MINDEDIFLSPIYNDSDPYPGLTYHGGKGIIFPLTYGPNPEAQVDNKWWDHTEVAFGCSLIHSVGVDQLKVLFLAQHAHHIDWVELKGLLLPQGGDNL